MGNITTVINQNGIHVKKVDRKHFLENAENGCGELFSWANWTFMEASRYSLVTPEDVVLEDTLTYYIMLSSFTEEESPSYWHISERVMNEFLKINFCYNQDFKAEQMIEKLTQHELLKVYK